MSALHGVSPSFVAKPNFARRLARSPSFLIGLLVVAVVVVAAVFAPVLAPYDPYASNLASRFIQPIWESEGGWSHVLGTDQLGRDYLSRLIYGTRISLVVGISATLIAGVIGTAIGVMGGYFGGRVDDAILFLINVRLAMPLVLIALAVINIIGSSLEIVCIGLGLLLWDRFAVVARSTTLQVSSFDYVLAARASGLRHGRIMISTILPNIAGPVIVVATLEMAHAILLEAALSFLGLGVPSPLPSWGLMIAEGKEQMFFTPWIVAVPGLALFVLVLGINLFGDGLQEALGSRERD